jgi:hypothetical protein
MPMTISELGALGEFIGAIAVLFTIIYLAVQVRHSRELLERNEKIALSQVYQSRIDSRRELELIVIELADILVKSNEESFESLTEPEKLKLRQMFSLWADWWDNNIYQESLGLMSSDDWAVDFETLEAMIHLWAQAGVEPNARIEAWIKQRKVADGSI